MHTKKRKKHVLRNVLLLSAGIFLCIGAIGTIWASTLKVPDFKSFESRVVTRSTKIYDRTGQVLLYDLHQDIKRTVIPFSDMSINIKNATVAIEDNDFYNHSGVRFSSFIRAALVNILHGSFSQGGSTITQQIVKNTLLTKDKTITRKLKEWILSLKMERSMSKEAILEAYLNEIPYGGNIYGIDEASRTYFGKAPADLSIAEASYLAAIPQAPTFYSPYGKNKARLDDRKNLVLEQMHTLHFITDEEYARAKAEMVVFAPEEKLGIRAPHFVFFVKDYLEQKYGEDLVAAGGLKITTTLDYDLQQKAEEIVKARALKNEKDYKATNASLVAIDPKTGQILTMVGSRDYFDTSVDGNYNVATAKRQPGSAFKPFVYATAFNKGYTPDTVLFDVRTEFSTRCTTYGTPLPGAHTTDCYMPQNYNGKYNGPLTIREALARSINVPAVKALYLVGINNAIQTAKTMGITTLNKPDSYGLPLVLGGGEVRLLDMTSAYGVFATEGVRHTSTPILKVEDGDGNILEEYTDTPETVLPKNTALMMSDILSDNEARAPVFGLNSSLYFKNYQVAIKTGTTNDFKDAWSVGYTPSIVVGAWVGNNDNTPMAQYTSSTLSTPMWHDFMNYVLPKLQKETFEKPDLSYKNDQTIPPVLRGYWQGGESFVVDTVSGKLATEYTPKETRDEKIITNVHDILYWVNKNDPRGGPPENPYSDPQFVHWDTAVQDWWAVNSGQYPKTGTGSKPTATDDIHTLNNQPQITIISPTNTDLHSADSLITIRVGVTAKYAVKKVDYFLNDSYIGSSSIPPFSFSFTPSSIENTKEKNELRAVAYDTVYNSGSTFTNLLLSN